MQSEQQHPTRPYRSRSVNACQGCRGRKSRCKLEPDSTICLMCRIYKTQCVFRDGAVTPHANQQQASALVQASALPGTSAATATAPALAALSTTTDSAQYSLAVAVAPDAVPDSVSPRASSRKRRRLRGSSPSEPNDPHPPPPPSASPARSVPVSSSGHGQQGSVTPASQAHDQPRALHSLGDSSFKVAHPTPHSVYDKDQDNAHIVGPANTSDSQVLTDYLSSIPGTSSGMRLVRMMPSSWAKPVLFTPAQNRTFGRSSTEGLAFEKLHIMEKLIGEHSAPLAELFFSKVNACLPLLDYASFISQYRNAKDKISPALLACLYAHTTTFWRSSPRLLDVRPPDHSFLWSLANDALYAELHTAPCISTIIALILDLGGRPTTSLIANGVLLGSAVALAHSMGLNRNPLQWDIPGAEKLLRMKIWWNLLIYDSWLSFAYGTPSHIQHPQSDVPAPETSFFGLADEGEGSADGITVFIALTGLTSVLHRFLKHLYHINGSQSNAASSILDLELDLNTWIDGLPSDTRRIIIRGSNLQRPGAANLRLCYLSIRCLLCRMKLDHERGNKDTNRTTLGNRYMQVQSTAEDIVIFIQELEDDQLNDFWLPTSAFTFTSVTTALLRSAVETRNSQMNANAGQNTSLQLAWDMILALRNVRDRVGWDLGEHCLRQYSSIVERLIEIPGTGLDSLVFQGLEGITVDEALDFGGEFPNFWDTTPGL